jgi:hypothetical protein
MTAACAFGLADVTRLSVDVQGQSNRRVPEQFLHHLELGADASSERRVRVPK